MAGETVPTVLTAQRKKLASDADFVTENIFPQLLSKKRQGSKAKLFMPIRSLGEMYGPELLDTIYLLGRENLSSIENMLNQINKMNQLRAGFYFANFCFYVS